MDMCRNALVIPFSTLASFFFAFVFFTFLLFVSCGDGFWIVDTWARFLICLGPSINGVVGGSVDLVATIRLHIDNMTYTHTPSKHVSHLRMKSFMQMS